jgi:hypothetical protein
MEAKRLKTVRRKRKPKRLNMPRMKRIDWDDELDSRLAELVDEYNASKWADVANEMRK